MKCINCNTDNNLKDRTANNGNCKNCGHPFVFEPTTMAEVKITDSFFAKAIADTTQENTLYFTTNQLLYFLDRRIKYRFEKDGFFILIGYAVGLIMTQAIGFGWSSIAKNNSFIIELIIFIIYNIIVINGFFYYTKNPTVSYKGRKDNATILKIVGVFILILGISVSATLYKSFLPLATSGILGILSIYLGIRQTRQQGKIPQSSVISKNQLQDWLNKWQETNGNLDKILPSPEAETQAVEINPEITNYSFDRVVVCDTDAIAQFLIANNFHFENNSAVLSITGYPQRIFSTVMEMLRRNPELKVYSFHDASPSGVNLVNLLNTSDWFANTNATIIDIGLLPRQVLKKPNLFINQSPESAQAAKDLHPEVRATLSPEELDWLDNGYFVELESLPPIKLIQILTRSIANSRNSDDILLPLETDTGYIYAIENFG